MSTRYQFVDDSGETRLAGTLVPDPGVSSSFLVATVRLDESDLTTLDTVPVLVAAGVPGRIIVYTAPVLIQGTDAFGGADLKLRLGDGSGWAGVVVSDTKLGHPDSAYFGDTDAWQDDYEPVSTLDGQSMYLYADGVLSMDPGASAVLTVAYFLAPSS